MSENAKREAFDRERELLGAVAEALAKLLADLLGHRADFLLLVQSQNGAHIYAPSHVRVRRTLEAALELVESGKAESTAIGRRQ